MDPRPTTMTARAVLKFGTANGLTASFSVPRARLNKTVAEARESMQAILDSGALELRTIGVPTIAKGVSLVKTVRTIVVGA